VKIGGYYSPELLPDYLPKLIQHNVINADGKLILCWDNFNKLCPGTLVLCVISLHVWNIANRDGRFKRVSIITSSQPKHCSQFKISFTLSMCTVFKS